MMIIGCDFHPSWQQIAWLDTETGETGEQRLANAGGDAEGSGADRSSSGSGVSQRVSASLPSEAESGGQGGGDAQVGRAALLDAAQEAGVSGSRSHREQPAGAPGR